MNDLAKFTALVLLAMGYEGLKWWKKHRAQKKLQNSKNIKLDMTSEIRRQIQEHMIRIQAFVNCNRVALFEYSNGTRTLSDISLQFINMTYEVPDDSTAPMINRFQLIAISPYLDVIKTIDKSETGYIKTDLNDGTLVDRRLRRSWSTASSYSFKIGASIWDGCLALSNVSDPLELNDEEMEYVQVQLIHIRELMIKLQKQ